MRFYFDRSNRCSVILFLIAILSGSCVSLRAQNSTSLSKEFALVGVRIYPAPDAKPIMNGVVVVANGKIMRVWDAAALRVPKGIRTIDCTGKTLLAGSGIPMSTSLKQSGIMRQIFLRSN